VLVACHHRDWRVHVIPPPGPLSSPYTIHVRNVAGGRTPGPAPVVAARCVDPTICSTSFVDNEVTITPLHPGTTRIVVDAKNTVYGDIERHAFEVVVRSR
jgi:hypothetical protein